MVEPKSRIDEIISYNNSLIDKIMQNMDTFKQDQSDDVILLILEKQIGIINFLKKQIAYYDKVGLKIERDKKAGKKTTLKKMKKVSVDETKNTKKEADDSDEEKPKKATAKKVKAEVEEPPKKKGTIKKKTSE